ncbi:recombinase family protein [Butyrivibrio sp. WCD3002]|uniref:recombinase family protein n=1 Tax=Butyrivibrio sp. WCD3002 TaxID=1280676 RepID=UPI000418F45A|nr:recombinase family protein [Butyrivibrio sp. WCD3002]
MTSKRAAIYHFTDGLRLKSICDNEIARIKEYAASKGYDDVDVFCDVRTSREEHEVLDELIQKRNQYSAVFARDYFHYNKYILKVKEMLRMFDEDDIHVYTKDDLPLSFSSNAPFSENLNVISYCCHWTKHSDPNDLKLKNDILRHFVKNETNWNLLTQISEEERKGHAGIQPGLSHLLEMKDSYHIILVDSISSIHWRTHNFCEKRGLLEKDIFSLREGFIKFERNQV